jgi:biotin carboxyl carrier protein
VNYFAKVGAREWRLRFEQRGGELLAHLDGRALRLDLDWSADSRRFSLLADGKSHAVFLERGEGHTWVHLDGERIPVEIEDERERIAHQVAAHKGGGRREVRAVMPGVVVEVLVREGDAVEPGQTLVVLEAMKMQNPIQADGPGKVLKVGCKQGVAVAGGALLIELGE